MQMEHVEVDWNELIDSVRKQVPLEWQDFSWRQALSKKSIKMTPFNIELMLHFRCSIDPFREPARRSDAYVRGVKYLLREGMIERPTNAQRAAHPGWAYKSTAKGNVYVNALTGLPLPVRTNPEWAMPDA